MEALSVDIISATSKATSTFTKIIPYSDLPHDLVALIKLKNQTLRRLQRNNSPQLRILRNNLQRIIKIRISAVRDDNFSNFIAEAEKFPVSVWKVTKALRNRKPILPPLKVNNINFSTDFEKANIFAKSLQAQYSPNPSSDKLLDAHSKISSIVQAFSPLHNTFRPATPKEISQIIRSLKSRKTPDRDGVRNNVLKILPNKHILDKWL